MTSASHRSKLLEHLVRHQVENLLLWQVHLADMTPAQRHALHEACIALADAICALTVAERRRDESGG